MELTYDNMMACMKKFYDLLPSTTPWAKDKLLDVFAPDFTSPLSGPLSEGGMGYTREDWVEHVASHYETYRAYVAYEPEPLEIILDERKKTCVCLTREKGRHPITGEPVKRFMKDRETGEPYELKGYIVERYEFTLVDGEVKLKSGMLGLATGKPFRD